MVEGLVTGGSEIVDRKLPLQQLIRQGVNVDQLVIPPPWGNFLQIA
jgi:hypothetical protein